MDLNNIDLLSLQTSYLQQDKTVQAICKALNPYFQLLADSVKYVLIYARIDELDDDSINRLAWQFHIDFYDVTLPIQVRRELVKNAIRWHRHKGTPSAVEELISTVFDSGRVNEWFEYGGEPYKFQVITTNESVTMDKAEEFIKALNSVKNERSWLDRVIIEIGDEINLYFAGIVHSGDKITLTEVI